MRDCQVCGPLPGDHVHSICHPSAVWAIWLPTPGPAARGAHSKRHGCWHPLKDHGAGLRCKVCGDECGVDCSPRLPTPGEVVKAMRPKEGQLL